MRPGELEPLTTICNGFFGGLAAVGVQSLNPRPAAFEKAFAQAWAAWPPASSGPLATFTPGRYGYRTVLYRCRWPDSVFRAYRTQIEVRPHGLGIEEFLHRWAIHAKPEEWTRLALQYVHLQAPRGPEPPVKAVLAPNPEPRPEESQLVAKVPAVGRHGIRVPGGLIRRRIRGARSY